MATTGFKELLDRIKSEGESARENEADVIGGMTAILQLINVQVTTQTVLMKMSVDKLTEMNDQIKDLVKDLKRSSQFADLKLADTVRKSAESSKKGDAGKDKEPEVLDLLSLSGLTAGLIGAAIGMVKGQLKAINFFSGGLVAKAVAALQSKILTVVDDIGKSIMNGFKAIRNTIAASLIVAAQILDFSKDSKFLSIVTKISTVLDYIIKPFTQAYDVLKGLITKGGKITSAFGTISEYLGSFGKTVGVVGKIVGKLFYPITVIMTLFDTIKGAIDGYAEGGILGALEGAITGFFTSLVTVPLDLVKDLISWVAGVFGFENFSAALDSFSFTDLFTNFVGGIFNTVRGMFDSIGQIFSTDSTLTERIQGIFDLLFAPIDAIKDLAASITDLLGLDGVSAALESFDITKMVTDLIDMISNFFADKFKSIKELFGLGDDTPEAPTTPSTTTPMYGPDGTYLGESEPVSSLPAPANTMVSTAVQPTVESGEVTARQRLLSRQAEAVNKTAAKATTNVVNAPTVNNVGGSTVNNNSSTNTVINTYSNPSSALSSYSQFQPAM